MYQSRVLIPVLASAAALGAVAYALSRPSKRLHASQPSSVALVAPRAEGFGSEAFDLDLDGIFDANPEDALEYATVRADTRVPALTSGDDAEPPSPEDLGAYWLTRATDSERSRDESDLELDLDDLDGLADPGDSAEDEHEDEDESEEETDEAVTASDKRVG